MSKTIVERPAEMTALPGATMLKRVRRLIILTVVCALVYSISTTASSGICPGGFDGNGGFIDANGDPTDIAPNCLTLSLHPNPLWFVVFALVVTGALSSALKKSKTEADALRYIDSAAAVIVVLTVLCIVVSHVWFWNLPVDEWDGLHTNFVYPYPFGLVDMEISPLVTE
jgi:hypothetical protein